MSLNFWNCSYVSYGLRSCLHSTFNFLCKKKSYKKEKQKSWIYINHSKRSLFPTFPPNFLPFYSRQPPNSLQKHLKWPETVQNYLFTPLTVFALANGCNLYRIECSKAIYVLRTLLFQYFCKKKLQPNWSVLIENIYSKIFWAN